VIGLCVEVYAWYSIGIIERLKWGDKVVDTTVVSRCKERSLGVLFDEMLSSIDQVNRAVKHFFSRLRQLHYFADLLSLSIKIKLVKSFVLAIFDYVDSVFFFFEISFGLEMKLNRALNNCIRFIYNLNRSSKISGFCVSTSFSWALS
jgi:hypothetical protein